MTSADNRIFATPEQEEAHGRAAAAGEAQTVDDAYGPLPAMTPTRMVFAMLAERLAVALR